MTKTSEGLRIVALGGLLDDAIVGTSKEQFLPFHTAEDAKVLKGANSADILITAAWPANIRRGSKVPKHESHTDPAEYHHIAELCQTLKPRYHFSSSPDFWYEREPFFHTIDATPNERPLTRFLSLAAQGNKSKQKAIFAFMLQKTVDLSAPLQVGTTASPFAPPAGPKKRPLDPEPYARFSNENGARKRGRRDRGPPPGPETCFFCLSNPNTGTHLVLSIGEDAYMTMAKGPLPTSSTNTDEGLEFPAHALIIPLPHEPTLALVPEDVRKQTYEEMIKFKDALQNMVSMRSVGKLGGVTYEISRGNGVHTHWQFMAVPTAIVSRDLVEAGFRVEAENLAYPQFNVKDVGIGEGEGDFFRVWIWTPPADDEDSNNGTTKCLYLPLDNDMRFDLQFGRRVLAKLLGLERRLQWRDCVQSVEEETLEVEAFKAAFKAYDFTI